MIAVKENTPIKGFQMTYSTKGKYIVDEYGNIFESAVDVLGSEKAYTESEETIEEY